MLKLSRSVLSFCACLRASLRFATLRTSDLAGIGIFIGIFVGSVVVGIILAILTSFLFKTGYFHAAVLNRSPAVQHHQTEQRPVQALVAPETPVKAALSSPPSTALLGADRLQEVEAKEANGNGEHCRHAWGLQAVGRCVGMCVFAARVDDHALDHALDVCVAISGCSTFLCACSAPSCAACVIVPHKLEIACMRLCTQACMP